MSFNIDFLSCNQIVIDIEEHSAVCKDDGYDLLNPLDPLKFWKKLPLSPSLRQKLECCAIHIGIAKNRNFHVAVHHELETLFKSWPDHFNFNAHTIGDSNIIFLIKSCVVQLAHKEHLLKLDAKFKKLYTDCFPSDIPHVTGCEPQYSHWKYAGNIVNICRLYLPYSHWKYLENVIKYPLYLPYFYCFHNISRLFLDWKYCRYSLWKFTIFPVYFQWLYCGLHPVC